MKRRTMKNVGAWPNMREDTLKAIAGELIRARKTHPERGGNIAMVRISSNSLLEEMNLYDVGKISAVQIYARAAQVAAMAIRVLEEGSGGQKYAGNTSAPEFKLTPTPGFVNPDDTECAP